ncbi:MAG: hypothetical protein P8Z30_19115 [Acidobacteriota bacterium]
MTNQSNFAGRIQDNWRHRAGEHTTFRGELRVIPRRLMKVLFALYLAAVVVVVLASVFAPHSLPQPFVAEPLALRLLAMFGIVTGIAAGISAFVLFYAYIACDASSICGPTVPSAAARFVPEIASAHIAASRCSRMLQHRVLRRRRSGRPQHVLCVSSPDRIYRKIVTHAKAELVMPEGCRVSGIRDSMLPRFMRKEPSPGLEVRATLSPRRRAGR